MGTKDRLETEPRSHTAVELFAVAHVTISCHSVWSGFSYSPSYITVINAVHKHASQQNLECASICKIACASVLVATQLECRVQPRTMTGLCPY